MTLQSQWPWITSTYSLFILPVHHWLAVSLSRVSTLEFSLTEEPLFRTSQLWQMKQRQYCQTYWLLEILSRDYIKVRAHMTVSGASHMTKLSFSGVKKHDNLPEGVISIFEHWHNLPYNHWIILGREESWYDFKFLNYLSVEKRLMWGGHLCGCHDGLFHRQNPKVGLQSEAKVRNSRFRLTDYFLWLR